MRFAAFVLLCCGLAAVPGHARQDGLASVTGTVTIAPARPGTTVDASNVAVWLKPLSDPSPGASPATRRRFRIVQRDKRFQPSMLVVPVGSVIDFPNEDPFFHNVFSMYDGRRFDLGLYEAGSSRSVTLTRTGRCFVFCNIHPEMSAAIVVVDTPYYAVTDRAGSFSIPRIPAGRYLLSAWHDQHKLDDPGAYPRELTITQGTSALPPVRFVESTQRVAHKDKYGHEYPAPNSPGQGYR